MKYNGMTNGCSEMYNKGTADEMHGCMLSVVKTGEFRFI